MQLLPGFGSSPPAVTPLPPLPTREDPAIAKAKEDQRSAELRRKGRRAAILTSGEGAEETEDQLAGIDRPRAYGSTRPKNKMGA